MKEYETVIVLDPTLDEGRVNQEIETVSNVIAQGGGEVLEVQRWGRRRLAYEVRRRREGIYSLIRFRSEGGVLEELERRFKLNESMMRHLTVLSPGPMAAPSTEEHGPGERRHDRYEGRYGDRYGDRHGRDHGDEGFEGRRRRHDDDDDESDSRVAVGDSDDKDDRDRDDAE